MGICPSTPLRIFDELTHFDCSLSTSLNLEEGKFDVDFLVRFIYHAVMTLFLERVGLLRGKEQKEKPICHWVYDLEEVYPDGSVSNKCWLQTEKREEIPSGARNIRPIREGEELWVHLPEGRFCAVHIHTAPCDKGKEQYVTYAVQPMSIMRTIVYRLTNRPVWD